MAIPKEILAVERPSSTKVRNINGRYKVVKRTSVRFGKKNYPVDLGTVGEIVDGRFMEDKGAVLKDAAKARADKLAYLRDGRPRSAAVPGRKPKKESVIDIRKCGRVKLCHSCGRGLLEELCGTFDLDTARTLYVIALIRAAYGNVPDKTLSRWYTWTILEDLFPGVHLSPRTAGEFMKRVGANLSKVVEFQKARVSGSGMVGQVVIDGTLKGFNSKECFFSTFSRKGREKGSKDMSILVAYSLDTTEPICSMTFSGHTIDSVAVQKFIRTFGLTNAFLVARPLEEGEDDLDMAVMDKGFGTAKAIKGYREQGLHYLVALKNTLSVVKDHGLADAFKLLDGYKEARILYKRVKLVTIGGKEIEVNEGDEFDASGVTYTRYLYAFRDVKEIGAQGDVYIKQALKKGRFSEEKMAEKFGTLGLIVFESDMDISPLRAYTAYARRWDIEVFVKFAKSIMDEGAVWRELEATVIAENFICLLSETIGCRVRKRMEATGVSKMYSKHEVFDCLDMYLRIRTDGTNWEDYFSTDYIRDMADQLGLLGDASGHTNGSDGQGGPANPNSAGETDARPAQKNA